MSVEIVTKQDLQEFEDHLLKEIGRLIQSNTDSSSSRRWLRSYQVRDLLNISAGTLHNLRSSGVIPHARINGAYFYDAEAINKLLENKGNQSFKLDRQ